MVLSKLFRQLDYNCYECAHTWSPDCSRVRLEVFWDSYRALLPLYFMLNSATHVMRHKGVPKVTAMISEVISNSNRSATSLGLCFFFLGVSVCSLRRWLGFFSPWTLYLGTSFACGAAILLERDSRVRLYNVYILQLISEMVAALLRDYGFNGHPLGNSLLLGLSVSLHMYLARTSGVERTNLSNWLRYIVGKEATQKLHSSGKASHGRNHVCPHHGPCQEFAIKRALTIGTVGAVGSLTLRVVTSAPRMWRFGVANTLQKTVTTSSGQAVALGMGLSGFSACYNAVSCALRHSEKKDSAWHCVPASLTAACVANYFWPSQRVAIYVFCNVLQDAYALASKTGRVPSSRLASRILFGHLCGMLATMGILKPHYLRKSYIQFLNSILGYRIGQVNWSAISHMGFDTAKVLREDLTSFLDPMYISESYKQRIWIWNLADFMAKSRYS